ncbi:relaxosome protein TraM [Acerihabitans sp. TG2]|uniref:relaxosome protein TraM n=1 Tax=Acerihabitans sp. TG2 TaxID=3096008 RepID=UPI002B23974B|nr:relaxosome protein TraM [Acerihabitans sp. TG2]MEA9392682.1 relaxosome protein TraM [Acerihabitans sp. TG2]
MGRLGIYLKDKIESEIRDIVQLEIQKGAEPKDVSFSSTCNELLRLGLIMHKAKNSEETFSQKEWNREVIRKVGGSREGIIFLLSMVTEMYLNSLGEKASDKIDEVLSGYLTAIETAEDESESRHFVSTKDKNE